MTYILESAIGLPTAGVTMDIYDITQGTVVASAAVVLCRIGWSVARAIDRRVARSPALSIDAAERLQATPG
jgi:hypothetical protein